MVLWRIFSHGILPLVIKWPSLGEGLLLIPRKIYIQREEVMTLLKLTEGFERMCGRGAGGRGSGGPVDSTTAEVGPAGSTPRGGSGPLANFQRH